MKRRDELTTLLLGDAEVGDAGPAGSPAASSLPILKEGITATGRSKARRLARRRPRERWTRQQSVSGYRGQGLVNTYLGGNDQLQGKLISPEFTIERPYISFLVGGGADAKTAIRLIVDGQVVRTASGKQSEQLAVAQLECERVDRPQGAHRDRR